MMRCDAMRCEGQGKWGGGFPGPLLEAVSKLLVLPNGLMDQVHIA